VRMGSLGSRRNATDGGTQPPHGSTRATANAGLSRRCMMSPRAYRFQLEIAMVAIAPANPGDLPGPATRSLTLSGDPLDRLACRVIQEAFADRLFDSCAVQTARREQLGRIPMIDEAIGEAQL
jgi:hypothetical protein